MNLKYFLKPSSESLKHLWENALIVPDANILLNLYRYSDKTLSDLIRILEYFDKKNRLYIPNQVAREYFGNKDQEIRFQEKSFTEALAQLEEIEKKHLHNVETRFLEKRRHPFVDKDLVNQIRSSIEKLKDNVKNLRDEYAKLKNDDIILGKLIPLLDNNTGLECSEEELLKIFKEGTSRYKEKQPPGFGDKDKETQREKFGDLITWKQILKQSSTMKKPCIFITDDTKKEDWYALASGQIIGPHPELLEEFNRVTDQELYIYPSDRFINFAGPYIDFTPDDEVIAEVQDVRKNSSLSGMALLDGTSPLDGNSMLSPHIGGEYFYFPEENLVTQDKEIALDALRRSFQNNFDALNED